MTIPNLRYNLVVLGADFSLFLVGLSFASQSTILPAFAEHLGASNVVIGAIPAVMTLGWFLPSLFAAGHTVTLARKLPFVLRWTIWERAPFILLALAAFFLAGQAPGLTLAVLLSMLLVITGTGGVLLPAWMDIVGRAIPTALRGRFFGVASLLGSLGGFLGSFGTAYFLEAFPAPAGYGVCFASAALFMALSYAALMLAREPPATAALPPARALSAYLSGLPALLHRDRNLTWFLVARCFTVTAMMASGFYTVYALRAWGAPDSQVGVFTAVMFGGLVVANVGLGWLADRAGHLLVLGLGAAATVAANVMALAAPSLEAFTVVFALAGVQAAAVNVSGLTVLLEFAAHADEQATYVGLGTTSMAPVAFLTPLLAGVMADALGFEAVFAVATVSGIVGLAVLIGRVRDPRWASDNRGNFQGGT
ncbi:MAG: MFS transporter [Candidatus Rokubacteria bacterium]|nr:MFS transporter [Candidatus Rokubacteria bacterium]